MVRRLLWVAILITSLATFGQVQPLQPGALPPTTQVYQAPVYVPAMPQVVGGYYTGYTGGGLYGVTTPNAAFAAPQPTAGISLADRAGISTSTPIGSWVPSTLPPSSLVYTNVEPVVTEIAGPIELATTQGQPTMGLPGARNLGPSRWGGAAYANAAPTERPAQSAGEAAVQHRRPGGAPPTTRVYTNADVQRILSTMPLHGINVNQRLQQQTQPQPAQPPALTPRPPAPPPKTAPSPVPQQSPRTGSGSSRPANANE